MQIIELIIISLSRLFADLWNSSEKLFIIDRLVTKLTVRLVAQHACLKLFVPTTQINK